MLRRVILAFALLLACSSFSAAEAGIPIPCTGTHYLRAPDVSGASNHGVALYYSVGCTGGRWVGYYSADGKTHLPVPEGILSLLPKPPGFWASAWEHKMEFWVEWFWTALGAFVVFGTLLNKLAGGGVSSEVGPVVQPRTFGRR
jgi:hypothetical protein